ncbi:MAG: DUF4012 domain-containing protein [Actinomycetota bacterium]
MTEPSVTREQTVRRVRVRRRRRRRWWQRRTVWRRFLLVAALAGGALFIDGAWAATTSIRGLQQVRFQLETAAEDLAAGRLDDADSRFRLARTFADRAGNLVLHPAGALADVLPLIGDDVDAVQTMARSVGRVADAGTSLVGAARAVGWDGSGLPGSTSAGRIDLEPIEDAAPFLDQAATRMGEARSLLEPLSTESLFGFVANAATDVRLGVTERERDMRTAAGLAEVLPTFLGGDELREYFVALQNLSAPRGTGGFLGLYAILRVEDGTAELQTLEHASRFPEVSPIDAPPDVEARYARFGGTTHLIAANYSPDFPTTAGVILEMWEAASRDPLDGVMALDPVWMAHVLEAVGPVETPAWPEPLTSANLSDVLHRQTFTLPQPDSDRTQEAIGTNLFEALLERPLPPRGLGEALARGAREGHLRVYSVREEEQARLEDLGVAGRVVLPDNPLFVVWQDAVNNRAGYFARKEAEVRVTLNGDGSARVETEVTLLNEAPDGPPSILLGQGATGDPIGYFAAFVNVYLPAEAAVTESAVEPGVPLGIVEQEFGHPVAMELVGAPPGEQASMTVAYEVPEALVRRGDVWEYRLGYLPQPTLTPAGLRVEIAMPAGAEVVGASPGLTATGPALEYQASPTAPTGIWVRFRLPS